jgi:hypothetical protein
MSGPAQESGKSLPRSRRNVHCVRTANSPKQPSTLARTMRAPGSDSKARSRIVRPCGASGGRPARSRAVGVVTRASAQRASPRPEGSLQTWGPRIARTTYLRRHEPQGTTSLAIVGARTLCASVRRTTRGEQPRVMTQATFRTIGRTPGQNCQRSQYDRPSWDGTSRSYHAFTRSPVAAGSATRSSAEASREGLAAGNLLIIGSRMDRGETHTCSR